MPWVVLTVEQSWQKGGRKLTLAAACGALQMLAGGPETILLTWLLLAALWMVQFVQSRSGNSTSEHRAPVPRAMLWRFPLVILLVAAIAAIQLLPFLDLAAHSQREQGYADTRWSMPGSGWANFLVPMVFGQIWSMGVFFQHQQAWTSSYYLGIGALLLVLFSAWLGRCNRVWLLMATAILGLLLALGEHSIVYRGLHRFVPQLSLMTYPVKFVIVVVFAGALLAAFGLTALQSLHSEAGSVFKKRLLLLTGILVGLVAAILFWAWRAPLPHDDFSVTLRNGLARAVFLLVAALVLWMIERGRGQGVDSSPEPLSLSKPLLHLANPEYVLPLLLLVVLWLDVWTHEPSQNPTVPTSVYTPDLARMKLNMNPQPALGGSRAMLTPAAATKFREFIVSNPQNNFIVKRVGYFADCNLLDRVPKVDGFFSISPRQSDLLNSVLYGSTNASYPHLMDFMSVSQITAPGEFFQWTPRDTYLPLVTAGQRPVYLDETNTLWGVLATNFDSTRIVCLPNESKSWITVTNETRARVLAARFENQRVDVEVDAAAPSLVTLSQTFYHSWRAYVDGQPTPLLRANYAFQAVQVPAGKHQVRLVYEDRAFFTGAVLSALAILGCLIGWWACGRNKPPSPTYPGQ